MRTAHVWRPWCGDAPAGGTIGRTGLGFGTSIAYSDLATARDSRNVRLRRDRRAVTRCPIDGIAALEDFEGGRIGAGRDRWSPGVLLHPCDGARGVEGVDWQAIGYAFFICRINRLSAM